MRLEHLLAGVWLSFRGWFSSGEPLFLYFVQTLFLVISKIERGVSKEAMSGDRRRVDCGASPIAQLVRAPH